MADFTREDLRAELAVFRSELKLDLRKLVFELRGGSLPETDREFASVFRRLDKIKRKYNCA